VSRRRATLAIDPCFVTWTVAWGVAASLALLAGTIAWRLRLRARGGACLA
jgi:hypothetical protein